MTFQEEFAITDEEKEMIIQHLSNRCKQYAFVASKLVVEGILDEIWGKMNIIDILSINFEISQVFGDVLVALGACRMAKKDVDTHGNTAF